MGKCKGRGQYIVILVFLVVLNASCISRTGSRPPAVIKDIVLMENRILVEVEKVGHRNFIDGLRVIYKNIPGGMSFETEVKEERHERFHTAVTLVLDITDMPRAATFEEIDELKDERGVFLPILFSNQEAELTLFMSSTGRIIANIFIAEGRIDILNQRFLSRGWR
jgi:hypothetical protein